MDEDVLTHQIIGAAMRVHSILGPGLLESVYRRALQHELRKRGLKVISEKLIPVHTMELVSALDFVSIFWLKTHSS
jgi:GxxExxY protein